MPVFLNHPALGHLLAVFSVGFASWLRLRIDGGLPPGFPYLTYFPAVILTTFLAGLWPGLVCAVLGGLAAWWLFIPPVGLTLDGASGLTLGFYAFIVGVDIALIQVMRNAVERLRTQTGITGELYEQQRVMFRELQHRVANNMTFVASLLNMKKRAVASAEAAEALGEAQDRLATMAQIHRRLYDPAAIDQPVGAYLQGLCEDLLKATGAGAIACRVAAPEMSLDLNRLVALSLLVTEVVTNSLKHAFEGRDSGLIDIEVERMGEEIAVTIRDDGPGLPEDYATGAGAGLGRAIISSLAAQLQGRLEFPTGAGAATRVVFAA